ncbi:CBS domain-containing protein [Myxosarcina sp. GI1(2024)]
MKASDIMTTNIVSIDSSATIATAAKLMKQHHVRALIVERASEEDAYGIITATDLSQAIANAKNPEVTSVCEVMTKPCIVVNPDLSVEHIAKLFARTKIRIAPVIKDKLLGIVSITDILTKTNCLSPMEARGNSLQPAKLTELPLDELMDREWQIESDSIYENWCSG